MRSTNSPAVCKRRKPRNRPLLKTLLLLSGLLLYLPDQIGATYGEFSSFSDTAFSVEACPVFPSAVENGLSDMHAHFRNASVLASRLQSSTPSSFFEPAMDTPVTAAPVLITSATNATYLEPEQNSLSRLSLPELETAAENASLKISILQEKISAMNDSLASSSASFHELKYELASGSASLNQMVRLVRDIPANCARISGMGLLTELEWFSEADTSLSPPLSASLADLIEYLRQVYEAGIAVQNVPNSLTNQLEVAKDYYPMPREATGDAVSQELLQCYEASQRSLEAELRESAAELHILKSRLFAIQAAAEENRLQDVEKTFQEEANLAAVEEQPDHFVTSEEDRPEMEAEEAGEAEFAAAPIILTEEQFSDEGQSAEESTEDASVQEVLQNK